jgi:regulatory protein
MSPTRPKAREAGPAPSRDALHEAALAYLTRSGASAAQVRRVLERRVAAWARRAARTRDPELVDADAARSREAIDAIVARFREVGLLDDAAFAKSRAESMARSGRSRRAIAARLAAKGVAAETVREALSPADDRDRELVAALTLARKRRLGPFAREREDGTAPDRDELRLAHQKALAALARAGFDWKTAERALRMDLPEAADHLASRRDVP